MSEQSSGPATPGSPKAIGPFAAPRRSLVDRLRLHELRRPLVVGAALVLLGVFVVGFGLGWTSSRVAGPPELPDTTVDVVAAPTDSGGAAVVVPDVRGLQLVDAQQAMADAGLSPDAVTTTDAPAALPAGTILRQDPIGGTKGARAAVLFVAVPGTVPAVVGSPVADAVQTLQDLGAAVRQEAHYTPGTAEGTVLAVEPAAGQPLSHEILLTVSGPAASVYLADIARVSGSCNSGGAGVAGEAHDHSVVCSPGSSAATTAYLLDRQVTSLEGVLGLADTSDPKATSGVRISVDGRVLLDTTVTYGAATPFTLDVTGGLRLEVTFSTSDRSSPGRLVLGDARLVGDPAGIDALDHE
jgi:hypothetical protein